MRTNSGYAGRLLRVDLTAGTFEEETVPEATRRKWLGGNGMCSMLVSRELRGMSQVPGPLDPASPMVFSTGPLTGSGAPSSGRYAVAARSPLTKAWADSDSGGSWGQKLKASGYDSIILTGKSPKPVYLWLSDDGVSVRPADDLWGLDTYETDRRVLAATDSRGAAVCIGTAGEKCLPFASIMTEGPKARAAGRCGMGAVMGSKNLKAIVVSGSERLDVADRARLQRSLKDVRPRIVDSPQSTRLRQFGTAGGVAGNMALGDMPAKNWTEGDWVEESRNIDGQALAAQFVVGRYHCPSCIIGCGRDVRITQGPYAGTVAAGPEYETLAAFGSQCMVTDLAAIVEATDLCNRYGLDVMSTGAVIAFAIEASENHLLPPSLDRPDLRWGNAGVIVDLTNSIALQSDELGVLLSKGVREAAAVLGPETERMAVHVRGLELAFHDPRAMSGFAVGYATYPRGGCHRGCSHHTERFVVPELGYDKPLGRFDSEGKGRAVAAMQDYTEVFNSLKLCTLIMSSTRATEILEWVNAVTGWDMTVVELVRCGERSHNLKRLFNLRLGPPHDTDTLHGRVLTEKLARGGAADYLPPLGPMLADYYAARGWDSKGVPSEERLSNLGIDEPR